MFQLSKRLLRGTKWKNKKNLENYSISNHSWGARKLVQLVGIKTWSKICYKCSHKHLKTEIRKISEGKFFHNIYSFCTQKQQAYKNLLPVLHEWRQKFDVTFMTFEIHVWQQKEHSGSNITIFLILFQHVHLEHLSQKTSLPKGRWKVGL